MQVCRFWQPWNQLVQPGHADDYLMRIKRRLEEPSARSGEYKAMIERAHGVLSGNTEKVCISGRTVADGSYHLDATDSTTCNTLPVQFLESNLAIAVERTDDDAFINDIEVQEIGRAHV